MSNFDARERFHQRARLWHVTIEQVRETAAAFVGFGRRSADAVVLKVLKRQGDEWTSGAVLHAFHGCGAVRVYEAAEGAMLIERAQPGHSLVNQHDDEAMDVAGDIIAKLSACIERPACPTVEDWAGGFDRYAASGGRQVPLELADEAQRLFSTLADSPQQRRLLHGDLHHYNILFDATRGWLAIDPKGVMGETEYEIGALLRNPIERPDLFVSTSIVERRVARLAKRLAINAERALAWGFAQAVLSAIWSVEDGERVDAQHPVLQLAEAIRPLLRGSI